MVETNTHAFTTGDEELVITACHMAIVPPQTPLGFKRAGANSLRVVSIAPARRTRTDAGQAVQDSL